MKLVFIVAFTIGVRCPEAQELVQLTNDPAEDRAPAWAPDGSRLLFRPDRDGVSRIYVVDVEGANVERVMSPQRPGRYPTWSPDGRWIAFAAGAQWCGGGYLSSAV